MANGELILYVTEDGTTQVHLRALDGTVWLTQAEIADLFETSKQNVSLHIKNAVTEREILEDSVVKYYLTTAADGKSYRVKYYNLDAILSIGYRVRSTRGTHFRRWATTALKEYLVKGFTIDDERLKNPDWDYFDELLERIREIRASESRFYRKVRDLLSLSEDYDPDSDTTNNFYAKIQNKMLYAVTGRTAAELIVARANQDAPNMGLTAWKGSRVRKGDVATAKNYLSSSEITELNLIVTVFLDTAELRAKRRLTMKLNEWEKVLNNFLVGNEYLVLPDAGIVSKDRAHRIADQRYVEFSAKRKEGERVSDEPADNLKELKQIANTIQTQQDRKSDES